MSENKKYQVSVPETIHILGVECTLDPAKTRHRQICWAGWDRYEVSVYTDFSSEKWFVELSVTVPALIGMKLSAEGATFEEAEADLYKRLAAHKADIEAEFEEMFRRRGL